MKFKELKVWNQAKEFTKKVYELTETFPKEEQYELVRSIRKAAVTSPGNIAKAVNGMSDDELIYYLGMARKNQAEIASHLELSFELGYMDEKAHEAIVGELDSCQRLTYGFMRYYKNKKNDEGEKDDSTIKLTAKSNKKKVVAEKKEIAA